MYENNQVPVTAPERFRVEITFSPGAAYNPTEVVPAGNNHALPTIPRVPLNQVGGGGGGPAEPGKSRMGRNTSAVWESGWWMSK